ncbi:hypothetical protein L6452_36488 [Arctium lappa]|uniref:Uncharacterized protein n=1 Tax=Arctium lappa TaxID=4217 RepID=A0ACB8YA10_ARCLA|nr:hypothetical protein L6452_36488 [Arctium lappa]
MKDLITSPTDLSRAKTELKRRSYGQNSVSYPLGYCDSDCDNVTIAVTIYKANNLTIQSWLLCQRLCHWHYSLRVMMGVWGLRHVGAMPWLYPPTEPLVIFLIIFSKVPVGGLDSNSSMKS